MMYKPTDNPPTLPEIRLAADSYNCYPGETITLNVWVNSGRRLVNPTLRFTLPNGLIVGQFVGSRTNGTGVQPYTENGRGGPFYRLGWTIQGNLEPDTPYTHQFRGQLHLPYRSDELICQADLIADDGAVLAQSTIEIIIRTKGRYLKYLPAFYEQDEFMGRFLMLFESFWKPIETQIDTMSYYFDPGLTPTDLLPWLASWLDLEFTAEWPEDRFRELLDWAVALHRRRGTKWALQKHLELYTGRQAIITENRLSDFILGDEARLNSGIALGPGNRPHTFSVTLYLPPIAVSDKAEQQRREKVRRRTIESIIEMQKPAHTVYTLHLEPDHGTQ